MSQHYFTNTLSLKATSVDVERFFSAGRLVLPYTRNGMSSQTVRALVCLHFWSRLGLIKDEDLKAASKLPDLPEDEEETPSGWDSVFGRTH